MGEVPNGAVRCPHCEAEVEAEPTTEEIETVRSALAGLEPEIIGELHDAFEKSESGEDFVNRIMIGDCPACGSSSTGDCENDPDIDDVCVARCLSCGQLWCPDCGELFTNALSTKHDCPAWDDMDLDDSEFLDDK
jgi:hypothetical protein